jgi:ribosomal protein S18 acetylase RimI-like enzyme
VSVTSAPVIREVTPADAAECARLVTMLGYPVDTATMAARLAGFAAKGEKALVAEDGEGLVGFVTLHETPVLHRAGPVGRITCLVVDERARGLGVGSALVAAVEALLVSRGCVMIEVTSNKTREQAHAFYEHRGYESTSFRFAKKPNHAKETP